MDDFNMHHKMSNMSMCWLINNHLKYKCFWRWILVETGVYSFWVFISLISLTIKVAEFKCVTHHHLTIKPVAAWNTTECWATAVAKLVLNDLSFEISLLFMPLFKTLNSCCAAPVSCLHFTVFRHWSLECGNSWLN